MSILIVTLDVVTIDTQVAPVKFFRLYNDFVLTSKVLHEVPLIEIKIEKQNKFKTLFFQLFKNEM